MIIFESDLETKALGIHFLMNPADYNNQVKIRAMLMGRPHRIVPDHEGPMLEFLNCFTYDEKVGALFHQEIFDEMIRNKWRQLRIPKLQQLDVDYIIAVERNDTTLISEIVQKKTLLRNVTDEPIPKYDPTNGPLRQYMIQLS